MLKVRPGGSSPILGLEMKDDGYGGLPDLEANDGIYSAHLLPSFQTTVGSYAVSVIATNNDHQKAEYFDGSDWQPIGKFTRYCSANQFHVGQVFTADSTPPRRIVDLQITRADLHALSLQWTAPGGDLDIGKGTYYY